MKVGYSQLGGESERVISGNAGYNFRFLMYKTGTARMARQGMEGKICGAPKARVV